MANSKSPYELEIAKGEMFLEDEEPLLAIPHASKAIEIDPTNPQGYLLRSRCYQGIHHIMALVDADKAIELDPTDGEAYCNRGLLNWDEDPVQARIDFEKGAELGSFTAQSALKSLNFKLGKSEPSVADIFGADATEPFFIDATTVTGADSTDEAVIYQPEDAIILGPEAARVFGAAMAEIFAAGAIDMSGTVDGDTLWRMARDVEDHALAVDFLTRAIAVCSARRLPYMHCCRAERLEKLGQFVEAIDDYSAAIELDEQWIIPYISRGRAFRSIGKDCEAEQDFDTALSMEYYGQEEELLERSYLQLERENYAEAIEDARRVIWTDSTYFECYLVTGLAFEKMGQLEDAAGEYTKAIECSDVPEHPKFLNLRAEIYDKLDRPEDAKNDRQIAMSIANVLI